jgi:hypothetical protein
MINLSKVTVDDELLIMMPWPEGTGLVYPYQYPIVTMPLEKKKGDYANTRKSALP